MNAVRIIVLLCALLMLFSCTAHFRTGHFDASRIYDSHLWTHYGRNDFAYGAIWEF